MSLDKTSYVSKEKLRVRIETSREIIHGYVHVLYRHRASDLLNDGSRFIPITDAAIKSLETAEEINRVPFLAINKDHIVTLVEDEAETTS